jgi:hypothetical protein
MLGAHRSDAMKTLMIMDTRDGIVLSVSTLWSHLVHERLDLAEREWRAQNVRGHGDRVVEIEEQLRRSAVVVLDSRCLVNLFARENVLYNAVFTRSDGSLAFGVRDSTYLFIKSGDDLLLDEMGRHFSRITVVPM